jgi:SAM-dependent MidA family methyltransferase
MTDLPAPDAVAAAHSDRLRELLTGRIQTNGLLTFAQYMEQVLYEPGLGYYMAGAAKFGAEGDFITAPEVSPLFGAALANEAGGILAKQGGSILELGAGSGKLALSILQALPDNGAFHYFILEPSAELVYRQQQLLQEHLDSKTFNRVQWITTLPESFSGVIIANEVMDALPVERFVKSATLTGSVEQVCVAADLTTFNRPAPTALQLAVSAIEDDIGRALPAGYCSEVCLFLKPWLATLAQTLESGVMLLVDYGYPRREYYLEERIQGTMTCYYRHRSHDDAFHWPGLQDITAHVDFTAVAEAAFSHELDLLGYASQSAYLMDNNLLGLAEQRSVLVDSEVLRIQIAQAVKTLTLPSEMGERFQVMALGRHYDHDLSGFRTQDLTYRL